MSLGVLCEGHRHLDGGMSALRLRRFAGICRSELCIQATERVPPAETKAKAKSQGTNTDLITCNRSKQSKQPELTR